MAWRTLLPLNVQVKTFTLHQRAVHLGLAKPPPQPDLLFWTEASRVWLGSQFPQALALMSFPLILEPWNLSLFPLALMLQSSSHQFLLKSPFKKICKIARKILGIVNKEGELSHQILKCLKLWQLKQFIMVYELVDEWNGRENLNTDQESRRI